MLETKVPEPDGSQAAHRRTAAVLSGQRQFLGFGVKAGLPLPLTVLACLNPKSM